MILYNIMMVLHNASLSLYGSFSLDVAGDDPEKGGRGKKVRRLMKRKVRRLMKRIFMKRHIIIYFTNNYVHTKRNIECDRKHNELN